MHLRNSIYVDTKITHNNKHLCTYLLNASEIYNLTLHVQRKALAKIEEKESISMSKKRRRNYMIFVFV
jgi:hypothetical protein